MVILLAHRFPASSAPGTKKFSSFGLLRNKSESASCDSRYGGAISSVVREVVLCKVTLRIDALFSSVEIPEFKGNIEVTDLATSLTNERFCKTFGGGYMNLMKAGMMTTSFPSKAQSVRGLYFAGQRMIMPGGLPMAIKSAWNAA